MALPAHQRAGAASSPSPSAAPSGADSAGPSATSVISGNVQKVAAPVPPATPIGGAVQAGAVGADGGVGKGGGSGAGDQILAGAGTSLKIMDRYDWMPTLRESSPSRECIRRVRNDIRSLMREPVPGLFVYPDEDLATVVHALITGPFDTPYEGGFFDFVMHCPDDYPHNPPRVRLMTTGGGTVRFNPNLYKNGKVCLSILGTWSGPRWTPVQSISSVLLSIQSLMNDKPYHNEPGHEAASNPQDVRDYNDCITHETLRVAVCSMVGNTSLWQGMPACFQSLTRELFLSFLPRYDLVCEQNMHRDGERMMDPFGPNRGIFNYSGIQRSIKQIADMIQHPKNTHPKDAQDLASGSLLRAGTDDSGSTGSDEASKASACIGGDGVAGKEVASGAAAATLSSPDGEARAHR